MSIRKVLFLAANPLDTERLRLEAELREIEEGLRRANQRDSISFICKLAVRAQDLRRGLLDSSPHIVHFSGHGSGSKGIVLEDDQGDSVSVATQALANLFALHRETVHCVILNACYSSVQAEAIAQHIPYVIGMDSSVDDQSALVFAVGFYDALGAGRGIESCFDHGCNAIELAGLPGHKLPVLRRGQMAHDQSAASKGLGINESKERLSSVAEASHRSLIAQLRATAVEMTASVQCIGMQRGVPFDQIYQPTRLRVRSGLSISTAAAFGEQNKMAQSIAMSRYSEMHSVSVDEFLESPENAVIFAGPGWGKTTFLHHIFRKQLQDEMTKPILITLRRPTALSDLERLAHAYLSGDIRETRSKVLLLVDGYDEILLAERKRVSECLLRFAAAKVGRFILTCRDHYQVVGITASQVHIDSFDIQDKYRFVQAFLLTFGSRLDPIKMVNELEARQFSDFLSHPLLLALACILKCGNNTEQPRSALRLLNKALSILQQSWDSEKGISREKLTELDGEDRMQILKRIAFASRSPFMQGTRAENIARKAIDRMQVNKVDPVLVLQETAQFYGILVPSSEGWEFVHRTIQDYLAARHWVDSGVFANEKAYEWNTRTAYAACISGDATRVLIDSLASPDGLTCAIETLTNAPDFDSKRVAGAIQRFYSTRGMVIVVENKPEGISAAVQTDLFSYLSHRFLNSLIEQFAKTRTTLTDVLLGYCLAELRQRRLRMDYVTFQSVQAAFKNLRFQFRLQGREFVTPEMAQPA